MILQLGQPIAQYLELSLLRALWVLKLEPLKTEVFKFAGGKKKKNASAVKRNTTGINAGYYMRFISKMMNEMDRFPEMKNFYIVIE